MQSTVDAIRSVFPDRPIFTHQVVTLDGEYLFPFRSYDWASPQETAFAEGANPGFAFYFGKNDDGRFKALVDQFAAKAEADHRPWGIMEFSPGPTWSGSKTELRDYTRGIIGYLRPKGVITFGLLPWQDAFFARGWKDSGADEGLKLFLQAPEDPGIIDAQTSSRRMSVSSSGIVNIAICPVGNSNMREPSDFARSTDLVIHGRAGWVQTINVRGRRAIRSASRSEMRWVKVPNGCGRIKGDAPGPGGIRQPSPWVRASSMTSSVVPASSATDSHGPHCSMRSFSREGSDLGTERNPGNTFRYIRVEGEFKHWELDECCNQFWGDKSPPERENIRSPIGLRTRARGRVLRQVD